MRYTPVRCYVLLDLAAEGKLIIERNGALEPSIRGCGLVSASHPFSEKRMLTAVEDLRREGLIRFTGKAFAGAYTGKAEVTPAGRIRLDVARQRSTAARRHPGEHPSGGGLVRQGPTRGAGRRRLRARRPGTSEPHRDGRRIQYLHPDQGQRDRVRLLGPESALRRQSRLGCDPTLPEPRERDCHFRHVDLPGRGASLGRRAPAHRERGHRRHQREVR